MTLEFEVVVREVRQEKHTRTRELQVVSVARSEFAPNWAHAAISIPGEQPLGKKYRVLVMEEGAEQFVEALESQLKQEGLGA